MSPLVTLYLSVYNATSCAGWVYTLYTAAVAVHRGGLPLLYPSMHALKVLQTAALLEVVHAALGLVRSPLATTALQVFARLLVLWGIVALSPAAAASSAFALLVASWGSVEVPRYAYYFVKEVVGEAPFSLTWLRYSLFTVLYPLGIAGEVGCLWAALPGFHVADPLAVSLPNPHNIVFDWHGLLWLLLVFQLHYFFLGSSKWILLQYIYFGLEYRNQHSVFFVYYFYHYTKFLEHLFYL